MWKEHLHTYDMYMYHIHTYTPATHTYIQAYKHSYKHSVCTPLFLFYRVVGTLRKSSTILLTEPAEVGHGFHYNDVWQELPPQSYKGGTAHRSHGTLGHRLLVELPHLVLGCWTSALLYPGTHPGSTIQDCVCICMRAR